MPIHLYLPITLDWAGIIATTRSVLYTNFLADPRFAQLTTDSCRTC